MKITLDNFKETINPLLIGLENNDNLMINNKYKKGEDNYIAALKGEMTIMKDELIKEDEKTILYGNVDEALNILFNDFDKLEEEENKEKERLDKLIYKLTNKINKDLNFDILNITYKKYDITGFVDEIIIYFKEKNPIHIPLYDKTDFGIITEIYTELIKNIRG